MKVRVIGCGGIGTCLLPTLSRFLNYHPEYKEGNLEVSLIDGDTYEERNRERQIFDKLGNKAEVTKQALEKEFPNIHFRAHPTYLSDANVVTLVREGDVVLSCVDNHTTRKLLSDHCQTIDNVTLISGGNEYHDGNVLVQVRKDGENVTLPLASEFHPEIEEPEDENPADTEYREGGCDVERVHEPQLVIANNLVAAAMLNAFYAHLEGKLFYDEVSVDAETNQSRVFFRSHPEKGKKIDGDAVKAQLAALVSNR